MTDERPVAPDPIRRRLMIRRAWHGFLRHRGYDSAATLTYFGTIAVLPAALLVVSGFALVDDRDRAIADLTAITATFAGADAEATVEDTLGELLSLSSPLLAVVIGLVLTFWTVSGYATAFGRAVNSVYEVQEGRPFWLFRARMLGVAAIVMALGAVAGGILLLTPDASDTIFGNREWDPVVGWVWNIGKWPLLAVVLIALVAGLYYLTPNVRFPQLRWVSLGSAFAIVIWAVITGLFALYVVLIGAYGHIYGRLGILLVGLLWMYLSNIALVLGAELDAEIIRIRQLDRGLAAEENVLLEAKDTRRTLLLARQRSSDVADSLALRQAARALHRADPVDAETDDQDAAAAEVSRPEPDSSGSHSARR